MIFRFLEFELDVELYEIRRDGERLPVERRVVDLLLYLVRNRDRVISRKEFLEGVWPDVTVRERIVDQMIYEARKVMADEANNPRIIETIRGRGWLFIADVVESALRRWPQGSLPPGEIPFVGRKKELAALESALDAGRDARGSMVLIMGEPGIGKSRLIEEFADRASRQGARAYLGRCPEVDGAPPFWVWTQLLRAHRLAIGETAWDAILERTPQVGQLSLELDEKERWRTRVRPSHVGNDRFLLYDTITRFWLDIAKESPVLLLLLDDLHRADESSLQLLRYLAGEVRGVGIVVVASCRKGKGPDLGSGSLQAEFLELGGLPPAQVAEFLEHLDGRPATLVTAEKLADSCGGNPLFLRHAAHVGFVDIPELMRHAVLGQLEELPVETRTILEAAAVGGRRFHAGEVANVTSSSTTEVVAALDPAIAHGLISSRSFGCEFRHVVVRDVVYESVSPEKRAALHLAYAERVGDNRPAERATHLVKSGPWSSPRDQMEACVSAAVDALERWAIEESESFVLHAEEHVDGAEATPSECADIQVLKGKICGLLRKPVEARRALDLAAVHSIESGDADRIVTIAESMAPGPLGLQVGVVDDRRVELLRTALALRSGVEADPFAAAQLALALYWKPESEKERLAILSALEALPHRDDPAARIAAIAAGWSPDSSVKPMLLAELGALASRCDGGGSAIVARILRVTAFLEQGDLVSVDEEISSIARDRAVDRLPYASWYVPMYRGMMDLERGGFAASNDFATLADQLGSGAGDVNVLQSVAIIRLMAMFHRSPGQDAIDLLTKMIEVSPRARSLRIGRMRFKIRAGDLEGAARDYGQLSGISRQRDSTYLGGLACLVESAASLGLAEPSLVDDLAAYADRIVVVGYGVATWGSASRPIGMMRSVLGDWEGAVGAFESAIESEESAGLRAWLVHTRAEYARSLFRRGRSRDEPHARRLIETAREEASRMGMSPPSYV